MKLLRTKRIVEITGLSRMTIYRMERDGRFPARRQLGANSVAWLEEDVAEWVRRRPTTRMRRTPADPVFQQFERVAAQRRPTKRRVRGLQIGLPLDDPKRS